MILLVDTLPHSCASNEGGSMVLTTRRVPPFLGVSPAPSSAMPRPSTSRQTRLYRMTAGLPVVWVRSMRGPPSLALPARGVQYSAGILTGTPASSRHLPSRLAAHYTL